MRYAIVPPAALERPSNEPRSLTNALGCTHTTVDVFAPPGAATTSVSDGGREAVCVPVGAPGEIAADEPVTVSANGVAFVPAGTAATLRGPCRWLIVRASAASSSGDRHVVDTNDDASVADGRDERHAVDCTDDAPVGDGSDHLSLVDSTDVAFAPPSTSDVDIARLTARLGCTGMKVNLRRLDPGQAVPYHTEGTQEELFVPLDGPGTILIDGERHHVPTGSVTRVSPETPRSVLNSGNDRRTWLMIGAPPTGPSDGWDPGAEILEWPERDPRLTDPR